ncbi:MAG: alpha/beta fold hydrolase [Nitrospiraceae bacterium]
MMNPNDLAYSDEGTGLPVLFIHAFPLNRRMWAPQVSELHEQFRVITVDLRGHGESGPIAETWTIDEFASDICALLDRLSIRQIVLAGSSMGGYVALAFYRRFADRVKGLVLADTRAQSDSPEARAARFSMIQTVESRGAPAIADIMLPKLLCPASLRNKPGLAQDLRIMIERTPVATIRADLKAMADRPDSTPLLRTIACPTLILVGELDQATPPTEAQLMAEGIAHAQLRVIHDAGHLPNLEQSPAFNSVLAPFLKTLS